MTLAELFIGIVITPFILVFIGCFIAATHKGVRR